MNQKTVEYRKALAEQFIKVLSEKELDWKKNWTAGIGTSPINATTGKRYRGLNAFVLALKTMENVENGRTPDNRWATMKQIQQKGWSLRKGSHGVKIEYWSPYDFDKKVKLTWPEYKKASLDKDRNVGLLVKYSHVFNGQDIVGIPEIEPPKARIVMSDDIIQKISNGMGVPILHDGGGRAFYRLSEDTIHLPEPEAFFSTYDYHSTALHELSHASGAAHRLNRDMGHGFGSEKYAYEELVAEISSCFMGEHLEIVQTAEHVENHKAYVQGWIREIEEKPEVLIKAIRDAGRAADFLEYHAGILTKEEYQQTLYESMEVPSEQVREQMPEEKKEAEVREGISKAVQGHLEAFVEADLKIHGYVTADTLEAISVQGYTYQNGILSKNLRPVVQTHEAELKLHGYKPTPDILKRMDELDKITGRTNGIKDIHAAFKSNTPSDDPRADKLVRSIGQILQEQELSRMQGMMIPTR